MLMKATCCAVGIFLLAAFTSYLTKRRRRAPSVHLPNKAKRLKVHVMSNDNEECTRELESLLPRLMFGSLPVILGLDCEWEAKEEVSVLQISGNGNICLIFRPALLQPRLLPPALFRLLEDPAIIKAGVGIQEDVKRLRDGFGVVARGVLEVRELASRISFENPESCSLAALASALLQMTIDKSQQCSKWGNVSLTRAQIEYAATDAWCSRALAIALLQRLEGPERISVLQELTDKPHKAKSKERKAKPPPKPTSLGRNANQVSVSSHAIMKSDLYENCRLLAPDGQLLCTCSMKKAKWYLDRGIAVQVDDEPFTVQLNFEPSGRYGAYEAYYTQEKKNKCVVCGSHQEHVRHHVVPHCYRSLFPLRFKSHVSHDILLLCVSCKARANQGDHVLMRQIGEELDAPLASSRFVDDSSRLAIRSAAVALMKSSSSKIPSERRQELVKIILESGLFPPDSDNLTQEMLKEASAIESKRLNKNWQSHAAIVVERLREAGSVEEERGIERFVKRWRHHFIETMNPQHLPELWSVESRVSSQ